MLRNATTIREGHPRRPFATSNRLSVSTCAGKKHLGIVLLLPNIVLGTLAPQALAFLTAASFLSGSLADDMLEKCYNTMREYREAIVATVEAAQGNSPGADEVATPQRGKAKAAPAPAHGGASVGGQGKKLDIFSMLRLVQDGDTG